MRLARSRPISTYAAADGQGDALVVPSVDTYTAAGVTGVTAANLAAVNAAVAAVDGAAADSTAQVQALADGAIATVAATVAALGVISTYAAADGQGDALVVPSVDTYTAAGVTGVTAANLAAVNAAVAAAGRDRTDTADEIIDLLTGVASRSAVGTISSYAADSGANPTPTVADYAVALNVYDLVTDANLDAVNMAIAAVDSDAVDTAEKIIDIVVVAISDFAFGIITNYADDSDANQSPTVDDYNEVLGMFSRVTADNLDAVNAAVAEADRDDADTIEDIFDLVTAAASRFAVGVITRYAADKDVNPAPTVANYEDILGFDFVTAAYLDAVNVAVAAAERGAVDTAEKISDVVTAAASQFAVSIITDYAEDSDANQSPTVADYQVALNVYDLVTDANLAVVNAAIAAVDRESADTEFKIFDLVTAAASQFAVDAISAYAGADGAGTAPTLDTYVNAGVAGVTESNLAAVNAVLALADRDAANETVEVQGLVDGAIADLADAARRTALSELQFHAEFSGAAGTDPTLETYANAGVTGVTDANLAAVNAAIASASGLPAVRAAIAAADGDPDAAAAPDFAAAAAEVQTLANPAIAAVAALGVISAYADDSGTAPSVDTYTAAGVTGVTDANLAAVNTAVAAVAREAADETSEVQALADGAIAAVAALGAISAYADGSGTAPTVDTYTDAGVTGVTVANLAAVNTAVAAVAREAADSTAEVQTLADGAIATAAATAAALGVISAYAADETSNPAPSAETYTDAGVTGVTAANLAAVNTAVAAVDGAAADSTAEVQALADGAIAAVAALGAISAYAAADGQGDALVVPSVADYTDAGVTGVTDANLDAVNTAVAAVAREAADETSEVQTLANPAIAAVAALGAISAYAAADGQGDALVVPSVADYTDAGVTGVTDANLAAVNTAVAAVAREAADSTAEVQTLADGAIATAAATAAALGVISAYAADETSNPAPSAETYTDAGVTGVTAANLAAVNMAVAAVAREAADSTAEVQTLADGAIATAAATVAALGVISAYAADETSNPAPTLDTYTAAGVTGVTDANLDAVNTAVAAVDGAAADSTAEVQALADGAIAAVAALGVISAYAAADGQGDALVVPSVDTYTAAGVTGVTDANLAR